jgi:mono/diheme cytochrome c family protein
MKTASLRLIALLFVTAGPTSMYAAKSGSELFGEFCTPCHGPDGKARTPAGRKLGAKDLSQSKLTDPEIEKQIANGTKDNRGVDRMPPFKEKLTASDVAALVAYVKSFRP